VRSGDDEAAAHALVAGMQTVELACSDAQLFYDYYYCVDELWCVGGFFLYYCRTAV
jgi:hypothetical protein